MAALNFPSSPTVDQIYTANGQSFKWDGTSWVSLSSIVGGTINGTAIGSTTPSTGAFTTLSASGAASFPNSAPSVIGGFGFRNRLINGDMLIDQRNVGASVTAFNSSGKFIVDRFNAFTASQASSTMQRVADAPSGFIYSLKYTNGTGATPAAGDFNQTAQPIEGNHIADALFGTASAKTITASFWVKSSLTGTFAFVIDNSPGSPRNYIAQYTINAANTWEYKTAAIPGDTTGTWATGNTAGMRIVWDLGSGSSQEGTANTWSANNYRRVSGNVRVTATTGATWQITGVQLEIGNAATEFERRPYGTELALCQRYFEKSAAQTRAIGASNESAFVAPVYSTTVPNSAYYARVDYKVLKRAAAVVTCYPYTTPGNTGRLSNDTGGDLAASSASTSGVTTDSGFAIQNLSGGALTTGGQQIIIGGWYASAEI